MAWSAIELHRDLRDFAATVSPDATGYITNLQSDKARIQAEIDRVLDGGSPVEASDEDIVAGVAELQRYLSELPGDFTRVVESYREFERDTVSLFRSESVASGEAVRRYLEYVQELSTSSAAGRGFEGALQLLRDPAMLDQVNRYITTLLESPRATDLLFAEERSQVRNSVMLIRDGLKRVLEQRSKVSRTLHDYISSHDVERDHELASTLRMLEGELATWMETAGPRAKAPLPLLPGRPDIEHLRTKMYDPADDEPPLPLADLATPDSLGGLNLAELRARGGPSHASLREELAAKLDTEDGVESLAALFHALPTELRRPVEILGVLPLARSNGLEPTGLSEVYEAVRPDGSRRLLNVPHYAHPPAHPEPAPLTGPDDVPDGAPHDAQASEPIGSSQEIHR